MEDGPSTSKEPVLEADNTDPNKAYEMRRTLLSLVNEMSSDSDSDLTSSVEDGVDLNFLGAQRSFENEYFLDDFDEFDDFDGFADTLNEPYISDVPLYPQNPEETDKLCEICYDHVTCRRRICCRTMMCDYCVDAYIEGCVNEGIVKMGCPASNCDSFIYRDEILARLELEMKEKYYKFLIDANKDPYIKTCPRCSHVKQVSKAQLDDKMVIKKGLEVVCEKCELHWCFPCHAPWHEQLTCKEYRKGDRLVQLWAHEMQHGQVNAQKCPSCKIFIQRTSGCDHMTCSSCKTSFCYRCGKRYISMKMFGNHFSRFSPFGCKYNLLPNRPGTRKLVRGAVLGGKIIGSAVLAGLAIAAGAVLVGTSVIVVPAVLGYKYNKRRRNKKRAQRRLFPVTAHPELMLRIEQGSVDNALARNRENILTPPQTQNEDDTYTNNWLMLSQLIDEQQVEVLVHRTLATTSTAEANDHVAETVTEDSNTEKSVITLTNVKEEITDEGYTRVIAHVFAKNSDDHITGKNSEPQSISETRKLSKESSNEDDTFKTPKDSTSDLQAELSDLDLTRDLNGCFVNIFSKKLNAWQVHSTLPNTRAAAKTVLKMKSGTWEKSGKKMSNSNNFDIKTFSNILTSQSERDIKSWDLTSDIPQCSSSQEEGFKLPCDYVTYL